MDDQLDSDARTQLDRFCCQYLQLVLNIDYPDEDHLRSDAFQTCIHARLFKEGAIKYTPPKRYQLRVLKELMRRIEHSIQDWEEEGISDNLMNELSSLLSSFLPSEVTSAQQKSYVTFTLSALSSDSKDVPTITLLESHNLLTAGGVTGFRTWEAAIHLGNYLCANPSLICGKSILELGCGTGYASLLCAKHLKASRCLVTDGSSDVVSNLSTNFYLNGLQDSPIIEGKELVWGHALIGSEHIKWNGGRNIDLVIGADVSYEDSGILALISTFRDLFDLYPKLQILIAATVRKETTFKSFVEICERNKLKVEYIQFDIVKSQLQKGPFYPDHAEVQLSMITRP